MRNAASKPRKQCQEQRERLDRIANQQMMESIGPKIQYGSQIGREYLPAKLYMPTRLPPLTEWGTPASQAIIEHQKTSRMMFSGIKDVVGDGQISEIRD